MALGQSKVASRLLGKSPAPAIVSYFAEDPKLRLCGAYVMSSGMFLAAGWYLQARAVSMYECVVVCMGSQSTRGHTHTQGYVCDILERATCQVSCFRITSVFYFDVSGVFPLLILFCASGRWCSQLQEQRLFQRRIFSVLVSAALEREGSAKR